MLCFARRSHRAAASLPLISLSGIRAPSALTGEAPYEDRFELPTTRRSFELHAVPRISTIDEAACLRTYALLSA